MGWALGDLEGHAPCGVAVTPDPRFVRKLRAYDPDLRVRWSPSRECWMIERKIRRTRPCAYVDSPDPDVRHRAVEGYIHVGNVHPQMLDERVLLTLWQNDMWRQGGAKEVNRVLDDFYEAKEARDDKTQREDLKHVAGEMWDYIAWRRKGKVAVPEKVA